ncbi:replication factor A protein 1 [Tanacetum coccineum]
MSNRYRYISELRANVTDNWTFNVMVSRVWTTYNLKNNQVIFLDIIIVDERRNSIHVRVQEKLINKYKNLMVEGRVHNIHRFMVGEYTMLYRPLDRKIFVEFCSVTYVQQSSLPPKLFDRHVFEFLPFNMLGSRDMRQVDLKEGVMDEEDTKEAYVKKDDMKESQI